MTSQTNSTWDINKLKEIKEWELYNCETDNTDFTDSCEYFDLPVVIITDRNIYFTLVFDIWSEKIGELFYGQVLRSWIQLKMIQI